MKVIRERQSEIFGHGEISEEAAGVEDHANFEAHINEFFFVHARGVFAEEKVFAFERTLQTGGGVEEVSFTSAGEGADSPKVAAGNFQLDVLNDGSGGDGVEARDVRITQFDDW